MQLQMLAALALLGVLCFNNVPTTVDAKEVEQEFKAVNAEGGESRQRSEGEKDQKGIQRRQSPGRPAEGKKEHAERDDGEDHAGENAHIRAPTRQENAPGREDQRARAQDGVSREKKSASEKSDRQTDKGEWQPEAGEGGGASEDGPADTAPSPIPPSFQEDSQPGPSELAFENAREIPRETKGDYEWHNSADAPAAAPFFGDLQQLNIPRFGGAQFPGFPSLPSLLGRSEPSRPRDGDAAPHNSQNIFPDLPGSANLFSPLADVPRASDPVHGIPGIGGDWKLPGWPEFGAGAFLKKNITIGFPGLPSLGVFPFGTLPELPIFPSISDLLQDPLNIEQLQVLFKEALTQIEASPLNPEKLKDIVDEIVRRVTPQESFFIKHILRADKEREAVKAKGVVDAVLEAARRVGQQLKLLKEVSIGGPVTRPDDVNATGFKSTLLGDLREVADIEDAFNHFRSLLEQLLSPVLNVLQGFPQFRWPVPTWA